MEKGSFEKTQRDLLQLLGYLEGMASPQGAIKLPFIDVEIVFPATTDGLEATKQAASSIPTT